ncbi:hypothetical protein BSLG_006203 [Batrachochytrium salamandrivorans]|nr:hypothetical protein BSLG_006203 [Batrachochytrium salamandrivorans]
MTTSSSSEELPTLKHTVAEDGKGKPKELNNALKKNRGKQYKLAKDVLKAREKFNQKHLEKQDEITSGEASNKKLPETQAQAAVKPSSMPRASPEQHISSSDSNNDFSFFPKSLWIWVVWFNKWILILEICPDSNILLCPHGLYP